MVMLGSKTAQRPALPFYHVLGSERLSLTDPARAPLSTIQLQRNLKLWAL